MRTAQGTDPVREIARKLAGPLRLEQRTGWADRAIAGESLAAYAAQWARQGEHAGTTLGVRQRFARVRALLRGYGEASPQEREARVAQALAALAPIEKPGGREQEAGNDPHPPLSLGGRGAGSREKQHGSREEEAGRRKQGKDSSPSTLQSSPPRAVKPATQPPPDLDAPFVPLDRAGRPAKWGERLRKLGIATARDLLYHFPRDYAPCRTLSALRDGERACFVAQVVRRDHMIRREYRQSSDVRYSLEVEDGTGAAAVVSFARVSRRTRARWSPLALDYKPGTRVFVEGVVKRWGKMVEVQYLEVYPVSEAEAPQPGEQVPIYPLTDGVYHSQVRPAIREALEQHADQVAEILPEALRAQRGFVGVAQALRDIHWPRDEERKAQARRRLVFEDFFAIQAALAVRKREFQGEGQGLQLRAREDVIERLERALPFRLTEAQRKVIREIAADLARDRTTNRLLQGDVGSGKTLVAVSAVLAAADSGYQAALMAPTEILAEQHQLVLSHLLPDLGVSVALLTGAVKGKPRREVCEGVKAGAVDLLIGTHALLEENVAFANLGLVIVDEQHRFGVLQRATLRDKGSTRLGRASPEVIVMTATPIPRTLALTVYGDLDVSVITELPQGRRPIETRWIATPDLDDAYRLVREQVAQGRQAYIVCPLIEESEKLQAEAATRLAEDLQQRVLRDLRVGLLHGRLKPAEKDAVMEAFRAGTVQVLACTTVIEVGVDVPNATVMVILNAERFGLAQLHQLRGRVGRGAAQSYCLLVTDSQYRPGARLIADLSAALGTGDEAASQAQRRMEIMTRQGDGFVIAEADLELRGPGDFYGTRQHGLPDLRLARAVQDVELLQQAREEAFLTVERDPALARPEHAALRARVAQIRAKMEAVAP